MPAASAIWSIVVASKPRSANSRIAVAAMSAWTARKVRSRRVAGSAITRSILPLI